VHPRIGNYVPEYRRAKAVALIGDPPIPVQHIVNRSVAQHIASSEVRVVALEKGEIVDSHRGSLNFPLFGPAPG